MTKDDAFLELVRIPGDDDHQQSKTMAVLERLVSGERDRLAQMFMDEANATREGAECRSKGSSIYNWLTYAARKIKESS